MNPYIFIFIYYFLSVIRGYDLCRVFINYNLILTYRPLSFLMFYKVFYFA